MKNNIDSKHFPFEQSLLYMLLSEVQEATIQVFYETWSAVAPSTAPHQLKQGQTSIWAAGFQLTTTSPQQTALYLAQCSIDSRLPADTPWPSPPSYRER